MDRPSKDETGLAIAKTWSLRSTCPLRQVGCLLVDKDFRTLSTGYNGTPSGTQHCIDRPCGAFLTPLLIDRHLCEAIHAEANALMYCPDIRRIDTCYTTISPCGYCIKLLLGTACRRIVFLEEYPDKQPEKLWLAMGKEWVHYDNASNL